MNFIILKLEDVGKCRQKGINIEVGGVMQNWRCIKLC